MNRPQRNLICSLLLLVLLVAPASAAEFVVIANADVAASVDAGTLGKVFLGKTTKVSGNKVHFATLASGSTHDQFLDAHVGKSSKQFQSYWRKQAFTGKASLPAEFASDAEMAAWVSSTPGAIGYISNAAAAGQATVVQFQ